MMLPTQDKRVLLTNKEMAIAFRGYDFRTFDMKAVCKAQITKLEKLGYHKDTKISRMAKPIVSKCEGMDDL